MKIVWHKLRPEAIVPTKREEDAGFDIYTTIDYDILMPGEKRLYPTGLAAAPEKGYWLMGFDRGSTGSKGIHTHCGIIDNGYRGEIFICLSNDNPYPICFTRDVLKPHVGKNEFYFDNTGKECQGELQYYPLSKAIAQIIPVPQPSVECIEADDKEWSKYLDTARGEGKLGASGK